MKERKILRVGDSFDKPLLTTTPRSTPTLPSLERKEDCAAAPICKAIGNLRKGCCKGSLPLGSSEKCIISAIQLLARIPGVFPDGVPTAAPNDTTEEKTKTDFVKLADKLDDGTFEEDIQLDYNK